MPFDKGHRAEIVGSESVFVTVLDDGGETKQHLVKYIGVREDGEQESPIVFRREAQLRHLDESLRHHYLALLALADLLGEDKLRRALEYVGHHVNAAAAKVAIPTTSKEAVR